MNYQRRCEFAGYNTDSGENVEFLMIATQKVLPAIETGNTATTSQHAKLGQRDSHKQNTSSGDVPPLDEERFTLDVRFESDTELSDDEVSTLFVEHRLTVEAVQKQQSRVLRALLKKTGVNQVFNEGSTDAELPDYKKLIDVLRDFKKYLPTGDSGLDQSRQTGVSAV